MKYISLYGSTTVYPFTYWRTSCLLLSFFYCESSCYKHPCAGFVRTTCIAHLGRHQGVQLLDGMVYVYQTVFQSACTIFRFYQQWMRVPAVLHNDQHLALSVFGALCGYNMGAQWYLISVICSSLKAVDKEHLSTCLFTICMSSLVRCPNLCPIFLTVFFVIVELYEFFVYFGWQPFNRYVFCKYFPLLVFSFFWQYLSESRSC